MAAWSFPALVATLFIAAHYLTLRAASGRIPDALGALLLEGSATFGLVALLALRGTEGMAITRGGVVWSCVSGLCITAATTLLFASLRLGGPVAATGTIVLGGGVALSALVAPLLFGEVVTGRRVLGVALGVAAIVVLATENLPRGGEPTASRDRTVSAPAEGPRRGAPAP
jgi:drug/metabolite transporter (DMT)-like permease